MTRHTILSIVGGPHAPQRVVLSPGQVLRVGSSEKADLALPKDDAIEKIHFEIDWDGERSEVRARAKNGATLLDGAPVAQAWAKDGAWLAAGKSSFMTYDEDASPPRGDPQPGSEEALRTLRAEGSLFAVVDAARDRRVLHLLRHSVDTHACLFDGVTGAQMADASPYLVEFAPQSRLLAALVEEGWGQAWATYIVTQQSFKKLRKHLRRLLFVEQEGESERLYFRYYDPRVLRDFIPISPKWQQSELLCQIDAFVIEDGDNSVLRISNPTPHEERETRPSDASFVIGKPQLKRIGKDAFGKFVRRMAAYLREQFSESVRQLGDHELKEWLSRVFAKSVRCGVDTEPEAAQLMLFFLLVGIDADETTPWIRETLGDERFAAPGKVRELVRRARERNIDGIEAVVLEDVVRPS